MNPLRPIRRNLLPCLLCCCLLTEPVARAAEGVPPARHGITTRTPQFDLLLVDLKTRVTSFTKWMSLRAALKSLGYTKDEIAQTKDVLRRNAISTTEAKLFCERWERRHFETIDAKRLTAALKQLLDGEGEQLARGE